jgi:hypothetical protein
MAVSQSDVLSTQANLALTQHHYKHAQYLYDALVDAGTITTGSYRSAVKE